MHLGEWPCRLGPDVCLVEGATAFQPDPRGRVHAVVQALQESVEEPRLHVERVLTVEGLPFLPPVGEQPFLR